MKTFNNDDSPAMRLVIALILRDAGFRDHQILEFQDDARALQVAKADPPNLIVSDEDMPDMTGIEFAQAFREADDQTPFGLVTTEVGIALREPATASGARLPIVRPLTNGDIHDNAID
jgi:two-component system chemotaxis response regulator CheY